MKLFKENSGFTLVELAMVLSLLGVLSIGSGSFISNSFKESNELATKAEVKNSVTALANEIETSVKTASIPVLTTVSEGESQKIYQINKLKNGNSIKIKFEFDKNLEKVTQFVDNTKKTEYEYIKDITISKINNNGVNIEIIGQNDKYKVSSRCYTRITYVNCTHITGDWQYDEQEHWKECELCDEEVGREEHTFIDDECICGVTTSCVHRYTWITFFQDHYQICVLCNTTRNYSSHNYKWITNGDNHYEICTVCNNAMREIPHNYKWITNGDEHYQICEDCKVVIKEEEHDYKWIINGDEHFKICTVCNVVIGEEDHNYKWIINGDKHYQICQDCKSIVNNGLHSYTQMVGGYDICMECNNIK